MSAVGLHHFFAKKPLISKEQLYYNDGDAGDEVDQRLVDDERVDAAAELPTRKDQNDEHDAVGNASGDAD